MSSLPVYDTLKVELVDAVARVGLNRPDKANAMDAAVWRDIGECFRWLDQAPAVRAVVLYGEGKHFCAGIDLGFFADLNQQLQSLEAGRRSEQLRLHILDLQAQLTAIERCRKPVLAAVHGSCIGGALDMITCCDMRYCAADAWFSIKEIDLGMTADVGTLQRLPRLVGDGITRELAYTGRRVDAAEALQLGLVNRVFDKKQALLQEVSAIARQIAEKSPLAIRGTKEMLLYARDHSVRDSLNYVATWNAGMLSSTDVMQAIAASAGDPTVKFED